MKAAFGPVPNAIGIGPMNIITPLLGDVLVLESTVAIIVMIIPVAMSMNPRMSSIVRSLVLSCCGVRWFVAMSLSCLPMVEGSRVGQ